MNRTAKNLILLAGPNTVDTSDSRWKSVAQNLHADFKQQILHAELQIAEAASCLLIPEDDVTELLAQQLLQCVGQHPFLHAVLLGNQFSTALEKKWPMKQNYHWLPNALEIDQQTTYVEEILAQSQFTLQQFLFCQEIELSLVDLTAQTKEVLRYILQGKTNKEISLLLKCSQRTIESRRQQLLKMLHVENAVAMAYKIGQYTAFKSHWS